MLMEQLAVEAAEVCGADAIACDFIFDLTGSETVAELSELLVRPLRIALIFIAAWLVVRLTRRAIDKSVARLVASHDEKALAATKAGAADGSEQGKGLQRAARRRALRLADQAERGRQRSQTLGSVLRNLASLVIYGVAAVMVLGEFNINLGPLIAGAGIAGVAVGFGAQSLVKDYLSGIFMLIEDQYGVGDVVDLGDASGVVEVVNLRTTQIRDVKGTLWHVPNGEIHRVANMSQQWARAVLDIEVAYDTDLSHAMTVIKRVADSVWEDALENATVLEEPQIWGVERFGADAVAIRLVVKVEPAEQWAAAREIRRRLKEAFDAEGIEIPFPQRTVWLHNVADTPDAVPTSHSGDLDFAPQAAPEGDFG